jgi:hypothetical protein
VSAPATGFGCLARKNFLGCRARQTAIDATLFLSKGYLWVHLLRIRAVRRPAIRRLKLLVDDDGLVCALAFQTRCGSFLRAVDRQPHLGVPADPGRMLPLRKHQRGIAGSGRGRLRRSAVIPSADRCTRIPHLAAPASAAGFAEGCQAAADTSAIQRRRALGRDGCVELRGAGTRTAVRPDSGVGGHARSPPSPAL